MLDDTYRFASVFDKVVRSLHMLLAMGLSGETCCRIACDACSFQHILCSYYISFHSTTNRTMNAIFGHGGWSSQIISENLIVSQTKQ
jgi:recombination DNA repair RAD52 pathway protein